MVEIESSQENDKCILEVKGEIDASSSIHMDNALKETLERGCTKIIVNMEGLEYISSAGLGVFMSYIEDFKEKNVKFAMYGLSEKVLNVFQILGLDQLLEITGSKNQAESIVDGVQS